MTRHIWAAILVALQLASPAQAQTGVAARARAAVLDALNDPRSALFRQVVTVDARTVCGRVSARNGFNGMVSQYFVFLARTSDVRFLDTDEYSEREGYRALCNGTIRLPQDSQDEATRAEEWDELRLALLTQDARARCLDKRRPSQFVVDTTKSVAMTVTEGDLLAGDPQASLADFELCVVREEQMLARKRPLYAGLTAVQKRAALRRLVEQREP